MPRKQVSFFKCEGTVKEAGQSYQNIVFKFSSLQEMEGKGKWLLVGFGGRDVSCKAHLRTRAWSGPPGSGSFLTGCSLTMDLSVVEGIHQACNNDQR